MNEMENSAYTYAMSQGAKWVDAMDFARWYWAYGRDGVAASWLTFIS